MEQTNRNTINTVIVLRNDQTTNWESSEYKLLPGEVGIGYLTKEVDGVEVTNVIAKLGTDGETAWKDLPQIEGVFEDEFTLTHDFGRYKTTNGSIKTTDAKGMTTSQWLIHALSETLAPTVTNPSCNFSVSATCATKEVGDYITKLNWEGSFTKGTYQWGSEDSSNTYDTGVTANNVTWEFTNNKDANQKSTANKGNFGLDTTTQIQLDTEGSKNYATITGKWTIDATNAKNPVNNIGEAVPAKKIQTINGTATKDVAVTAHRKSFWGVKAADASVDIAKLTSDDVRGLGSKSSNDNTPPASIAVPAGSQQVIIAIKKNLKTSLVAKDTSAMNAVVTFTRIPAAVSVEGANGFTGVDYDIWYVDWNPDKVAGYTGIGSAKTLSLTWA